MKSLRSLSYAILVFTLFSLAPSAFAWACTDPDAVRTDVGTTQPSGNPGDGNGQWFLGTGTEGIKGHYYVCKCPPKKTRPAQPPVNISVNANQNQQQQQTQQQEQTATGGNATATGGNAQAKASDNGNGNGNGSNNYSSDSVYEAAKNPVSTAFAPTQVTTTNCFKGYGAGVQTMPLGMSLGGGKIDSNCRALQTMIHSPNRVTFCKIFIRLQDAKAAGVTFEDCMETEPEPEAKVVVASPQPASPVNIYLPTGNGAPAVAATTQTSKDNAKPELAVDQLIGVCTFTNSLSCQPNGGQAVIHPTSVCKEMLEEAKRRILSKPGSVLLITGNQNPSEDHLTAEARANNVRKQLEKYGVPSDRIKMATGEGTSRTVEVVLTAQQ